ncbi:helix-turn-helix domain-containing protein [Rugamonas rubra]|uniref:Helix-turn-helix domain-containing protein n=1 Tax=Rugamonas rubra TaxID=758825 RepID=A0A1I4RZN6_9BURK|nr:helix-turn-helix domain-containing protein [Rugamonas rubra]SFM57772.1 Helix-turn-helix domain-containing protein [Rugamonas rubra]
MPPQVFAPAAPLAPLLMHIMALRLDGCEFHLPASLSPGLVLYVRGGVSVLDPAGMAWRRPRFELAGAFMAPRRALADPGTLVLTVLLRPGMLRQALGIPAWAPDSVGPALEQLVDPARLARLLAAMDAERPLAEYVELLQQFLLETLDWRSVAGFGAALLAVRQKIFLPVVEIASWFGLGERQLERRVLQTFGLSLRDVRRVSRFGFALRRLLRQGAAGGLAALAHDAGYFDQPHMVRDFRELAGLAPAQLLAQAAGSDPAYWLYRIAPDDFDKLFFQFD